MDIEYLELRRKREEFSLNFRSIHRQDLLRKKRNIFSSDKEKSSERIQNTENLCISDNLQTQIEYFAAKEFSIKDLPKLVEYSKSDKILEQHFACVGIRKLLSFGNFPVF